MDRDDPIAVTLAVTRVLREERVAHALYGGLLLATYGEARETRDADLAVLRADAVSVAASLERSLGIRAMPAFERRAFGGLLVSLVTLIEGDDLNTLDLVEPADAGYAARALDRSIESTLRGAPIRLLTAEDFVVFKVLSTRELDLADAASVVRNLGEGLERSLVEDELPRWRARRPAMRAASAGRGSSRSPPADFSGPALVDRERPCERPLDRDLGATAGSRRAVRRGWSRSASPGRGTAGTAAGRSP
jgi:hypothetical protein